MSLIRTFISKLSQLFDVVISAPADGDALRFDAASGTWQNEPTPSASDLSDLEIEIAAKANTSSLAAVATSGSASDLGSGTLANRPVTFFISGGSGGTLSIANGSLNAILTVKNVSNATVFSVNTGGAIVGSGSGITSLNASNISSGTLAAGRLPNPSAIALGGVQSAAAQTSKWIDSILTTGTPHFSQPAATDISGLATSATTDTTNAANIGSGTLPAARLPTPTSTTLGGVKSFASVNKKYLKLLATDGTFVAVQPQISDLSDAANVVATGVNNVFTVDQQFNNSILVFSQVAGGSISFFGDDDGAGNPALTVSGAISYNFDNTIYAPKINMTDGVFVLPVSSSAPASPVEGQTYLNSTDHHIYCYNGTTFKQLDN